MRVLINLTAHFRHGFKLRWVYIKYNFYTHKSFTHMHIYATSHMGRLEGACCSSAPHLLPTRHPLTSSLEKEGSLFVMESICLFPIPTVGNMETKPPSHFPFHSPPISSPPPSLYTSQTEHCMISYIFEWFAESETQQMQIFSFFLLPSDMLLFRRKSNWSVTLCTTLVIQPPIVTPGTIFPQTYFYAFLCGFRHIKKDFACQPDGGLLWQFLMWLWLFCLFVFFIEGYLKT